MTTQKMEEKFIVIVITDENVYLNNYPRIKIVFSKIYLII